jgi:hypothetical protein
LSIRNPINCSPATKNVHVFFKNPPPFKKNRVLKKVIYFRKMFTGTKKVHALKNTVFLGPPLVTLALNRALMRTCYGISRWRWEVEGGTWKSFRPSTHESANVVAFQKECRSLSLSRTSLNGIEASFICMFTGSTTI